MSFNMTVREERLIEIAAYRCEARRLQAEWDEVAAHTSPCPKAMVQMGERLGAMALELDRLAQLLDRPPHM